MKATGTTIQPKGKGARALRVLALGLLMALLCALFSGPVYAETPAEKYKRLKEELEQTRSAIKSYENSVTQNQQLKAELEKQKAIIDEMVEVNKQQIADTEARLRQKEEEIADKRQVIYENDQLLQQRLLAIYSMNNANATAQLLNVDSFSELMLMLDGMRRISKHDTDLLELLNEQRAMLEEEQASIDADLADLEVYYAQLLENQEDLAQNIVTASQNISYAQAQVEAQKEIEGDQYAALLQAQKEMQAIAGSIGGSRKGDGSTYVGGVFTWPVPGHYTITCHFGSPDPNGSPHRGMDISSASVYGADIVACGDGTVIQATYAHSSYGNYIVVDHGDGVKTLYAHCSQLYLSPGSDVKKGDTIAAVGSTGFSTGPHLHLEVHADGGLSNPANWLKG
ncbi:peptidoglycan DD-metalloendopeptidase family protein [Ruminococcaceae bacterium OttesenSCG-928-D13]|nr:peptidoglycan DD-metalloendopeptidase family protein [Ruminococcaceae bacterium OttesenSCG-928-D13]